MIYKLGLVALGGALGALSRYGLGRALHHWNPHPWFSIGTLVANVVGCFLMGASIVWIGELDEVYRDALSAFILVGFLGSLTTFSTFILEFVKLAQHSEFKVVLTQCAAHLILGVVGLWLGHSLAQKL